MMAMKPPATSTGTLLRAFIDLHCPAERNGEGDSAGSDSGAASYFSFTKSNTKIAHTPTVMGNCTKEASRSAPPLGRTYVAAIIARAVSTPRANLLFQLMRVRPPFPVWDFENGSDCTPCLAVSGEAVTVEKSP
jgi:hypothetical protein